MERVEYSDAYIRDVGISPRTFKIENDSGGKILSLFPNMLPKDKTPDQVVELLSRSREAVVWLERQNGLIIVNGIRTEFLNIPPSRGLRLHERNRQFGAWFAGGLFLAGLFVYIYFKRYFDLDWKLSTKE